MGTPRPPSMIDVAHLAGVSHQTVSRVLNGHPNVSPHTRMRVLAAINELGYRPNSAARTLVTGSSRTIGVIGLDSTLYGPAATMHGVDQAAMHANYLVNTVGLASIDRPSVLEALDRLAHGAVDGVVVIAPLSSAREALMDLPVLVPIVAVNAHPRSDIAAVTVDQELGAQLATKHLLSTGASTVWHLAGPGNWSESEGRAEGWRRTLVDAGADVPPPLTGDWSARSGYEAGQVLARMPDVTAVFVANDHMALGLLRAMHERGKVVPDDVSVVGFDDIPEAAYFIPPLTTVRQDFSELGRRCVQLLVEQIESRDHGVERIVVDPVLVVRQSTTSTEVG
jgi:DNA-binding LacI/PurR family transcriptional regulator